MARGADIYLLKKSFTVDCLLEFDMGRLLHRLVIILATKMSTVHAMLLLLDGSSKLEKLFRYSSTCFVEYIDQFTSTSFIVLREQSMGNTRTSSATGSSNSVDIIYNKMLGF